MPIGPGDHWTPTEGEARQQDILNQILEREDDGKFEAKGQINDLEWFKFLERSNALSPGDDRPGKYDATEPVGIVVKTRSPWTDRPATRPSMRGTGAETRTFQRQPGAWSPMS